MIRTHANDCTHDMIKTHGTIITHGMIRTHAMIANPCHDWFPKWLVYVVQVIHYNGCGPYPANCGNNNNQTSQVSVSVFLFSSFIQVKFNIFIIFKNLILMSCD